MKKVKMRNNSYFT